MREDTRSDEQIVAGQRALQELLNRLGEGPTRFLLWLAHRAGVRL